MVIFYFFIFILMLYGIRYKPKGFFGEYLEKTQCNAIKGIFILVVFMRHVVPYVVEAGYEMPTLLDKGYYIINEQIGQLLVVMFLFYSGYGVMESIKRKGNDYVRNIPQRRVLSTFLNFDIAVTLFLLMDFALDINVTTEQYLLSRFGWESVGNSNWYIFIILLFYSLSFFSFRLSRRWGILILITMTFVAVAILYFIKKPWWYNTMLSYPAGMVLSMYKVNFDAIIKGHYLKSILLITTLFLVFHVANFMMPSTIAAVTYNMESIFFAFMMIIFTMKVCISNRVLAWLGLNLFPLYIYQRLPMIAMREFVGLEWLSLHPYIFVFICFILSVVITYLYKYWRISL